MKKEATNRERRTMRKKLPLSILMLIICIAALYFVISGAQMRGTYEEVQMQYQEAQTEYYSQNKAIRDGAGSGAELNTLLVEILNTPSELSRIQFVGIGKILIGIFILLVDILIALLYARRPREGEAPSTSTRHIQEHVRYIRRI